jgi:hypothetical protein
VQPSHTKDQASLINHATTQDRKPKHGEPRTTLCKHKTAKKPRQSQRISFYFPTKPVKAGDTPFTPQRQPRDSKKTDEKGPEPRRSVDRREEIHTREPKTARKEMSIENKGRIYIGGSLHYSHSIDTPLF